MAVLHQKPFLHPLWLPTTWIAGTCSKDANRGERVKIQKGAEPSESGGKRLEIWGVQCNCFFSGKYMDMEILCKCNISIHIPTCPSVHCNITLLGACFPRNPESPMRMGSDNFHSVDNRVLFFFRSFSLGASRFIKNCEACLKSSEPLGRYKTLCCFAYHINMHIVS